MEPARDAKRLRLLGVTVHPEFAVDHEGTLTKVQSQPIYVNATDWPDYPATLEAQRADQEAAINAEG